MKLLLATGNLHKILELKTMLKALFPNLDIYSLRDFKDYASIEETEDTFEGNAKLKATDAAKHFNMLTLADDSGLVVPSLRGAPGVRSARYAGEKVTAKENITKLLHEMKNLEGEKRNAHYNCAFCLASPEKILKTVSAICEGRIIDSTKGAGGFGYDPIFIKHDYNSTFAEITNELKLKISHRRRALDKIIPILETKLHCTIS